MAVNPRRSVYQNPSARSWFSQPQPNAALAFHRSLPNYEPTALHPLEAVAKAIGAKSVFLKDESTRIGLPSFKALGASWAIHQVIAKRAGFPAQATLSDLSIAAKNFLLHFMRLQMEIMVERWRGCLESSTSP